PDIDLLSFPTRRSSDLETRQEASKQVMVDGCRLPLTGKLHDPVGLPGLAAVGRERLFPTAGIRGVDVPDEAVENVPAFEHFLRIEFSARAIELADHWQRHSFRMAAGRPIDAPLARCGIIETHRHC